MRAGVRHVGVLVAILLATMWSPVGAAAADSISAVDSCPADGAVSVTGRQRSVTASAPEGYRITGYCVTVRGQGSEVHTFATSAASAELTHSSGKAIEEYVLAYEEIPAATPDPDESASPDPAPTPTSSATPSASASAGTEETDDVEATDETDGAAAAPRSMMDIDALLSNRENAEERASAQAAVPRASGATSGLAPIAVAALVLTGLAGIAVVAYLLLRQKHRAEPSDASPPTGDVLTDARHLDAPTRAMTAVPGATPATDAPSSDDVDAEPRSGPSPRRGTPTFVVGDDTDFPSIR